MQGLQRRQETLPNKGSNGNAQATRPWEKMHGGIGEQPRYVMLLPHSHWDPMLGNRCSHWEIGDPLLGPAPFISRPPDRRTIASREGRRALMRTASGTQRTENLGPLWPRPLNDYIAKMTSPRKIGSSAGAQRHQRHSRPGLGFSSEFHPRVLDYRTVEELSVRVGELDGELKPRTAQARRAAKQAVYDLVHDRSEELASHARRTSDRGAPSENIVLAPGVAMHGEIRPVLGQRASQYVHYEVLVPERAHGLAKEASGRLPAPDATAYGLRVRLTAVDGDPDLLVCTRNVQPKDESHEHTWSARLSGSDEIAILPDEPNFLPGLFYISVFCTSYTSFDLVAELVPHVLPRQTVVAPRMQPTCASNQHARGIPTSQSELDPTRPLNLLSIPSESRGRSLSLREGASISLAISSRRRKNGCARACIGRGRPRRVACILAR